MPVRNGADHLLPRSRPREGRTRNLRVGTGAKCSFIILPNQSEMAGFCNIDKL
jgi:hypothetical protein